jgi:hypothetical protein
MYVDAYVGGLCVLQELIDGLHVGFHILEAFLHVAADNQFMGFEVIEALVHADHSRQDFFYAALAEHFGGHGIGLGFAEAFIGFSVEGDEMQHPFQYDEGFDAGVALLETGEVLLVFYTG